MELIITKFWNEACPKDYSASVAEIGVNAGTDTWQAAKDDAGDYNLLDTPEKLEAFRAFVRSSGGWNDKEIAEFSNTDLNALCIQWISGDIREVPDMDLSCWDWNYYNELAEQGRISSRLFEGIDGEIYFCIGD